MWKWVVGVLLLLGVLSCVGAIGGAGWWVYTQKQAADAAAVARVEQAEQARAALESAEAAKTVQANHVGEARVAYAAGDWQQAADEWSAVLDVEATNAEALRGRGRSFARLERFGPAAEDLGEATRLDGANAEGWETYGWVLGQLHRDDEAVAAYDRLVALDDHNAKAWRDRANAKFRAGDTSGARADAVRACDLGLQDGCTLVDRIRSAGRR